MAGDCTRNRSASTVGIGTSHRRAARGDAQLSDAHYSTVFERLGGFRKRPFVSFSVVSARLCWQSLAMHRKPLLVFALSGLVLSGCHTIRENEPPPTNAPGPPPIIKSAEHT